MSDSNPTTKHHSVTHGMSHTPTWWRWASMKQRCYDPNHKQYKDWGGRGIVVCKGLHDFSNFHALLDDLPSERELDRVENNGNYSCGKCAECLANNWPMNIRWSTKSAQARNTRSNRLLTLNSQTKTIAEWSVITGIASTTIRQRLDQNKWSVEKSLTTPVVKSKKRVARPSIMLTLNGETHSRPEWANLTGIPLSTIRGRLKNGDSVEQALSLNRTPALRKRKKIICLTISGETLPLTEWAKRTSLPAHLVLYRYHTGRSHPDCLLPPALYGRNKLTIDGQTDSVLGWARKLSISKSAIYSRLRRGLSDAECLVSSKNT